jgi:hypothetical protein
MVFKQRLRGIDDAIRGLDAAWTQLSGEEPDEESEPILLAISGDYDKSQPFKKLWSHRAIIMEVAKRMTGSFGVNEVKAAIDEITTYSKFAPLIQKATISGRLKKMADPANGALEIVCRGLGTRPSIYRVKERKEAVVHKQGPPALTGSPESNLMLAETV